jgi:hypothetical protein
MTDDLIASAEWLRSKNNRGYGKLAIPQPIDDRITELLQTWAALGPPERLAATLRVLEEQRFTLLAYSGRMASLAVRTRDLEKISLGLLALGVDDWRFDWRDNITVLSLHYDAAQRLSVAAAPLFEKAAALLSPKMATAFASFLLRAPADKSIRAMGYVAESDDGGFRYLKTW